jgi:hypothetical protein
VAEKMASKLVWKYEVVPITDLRGLQEDLSSWGEDGWELVQVITHVEYPLGFAIFTKQEGTPLPPVSVSYMGR